MLLRSSTMAELRRNNLASQKLLWLQNLNRSMRALLQHEGELREFRDLRADEFGADRAGAAELRLERVSEDGEVSDYFDNAGDDASGGGDVDRFIGESIH